jgi:signal transduction histidine kinase
MLPRYEGGMNGTVPFRDTFEQSPSRMLVLAPEAPFVIRASTEWFYEATFTNSDILGQPMFRAFPDNPNDPHATGVARLSASFERALARQTPDAMPVQRYDRRDRSGRFVERYWTPINRPVFSGGTVSALVHRVEDVTHLIREGKALLEDSTRLNEKLEMRAHDLSLAGALRDEVEQRRRISAVVAHDLRSPLLTISTGVHVLRSHFKALGVPPPRTVDLLGGAAARMEHMLNDLDDYSNRELRGLLAVAREWVEVRAICEEVVRAMQITYPDRRLELEARQEVAAWLDCVFRPKPITDSGASRSPIPVEGDH